MTAEGMRSGVQTWTTRPLIFPNSNAGPQPDHSLAGVANGDLAGFDHEELFAELWQREETLVLPLFRDEVLVDADRRLALLTPSEISPIVGERDLLRLYLGRVAPIEGIPDDGVLVAGTSGDGEEVPVIAVILTVDERERVDVGEWISLRTLSADLDARDVGLTTRAVALANWHRSHEFSPRSGRATMPKQGGWVRVDPDDGSEHFPRTDPAVIIAITDEEERILLASNQQWDERVYSLVAGFVDPGESLEQAVIREVREETGLTVRDPKYLGSQPWPFPASLMLGFQATLDDSLLNERPDGVEIRALRWFTREELAQSVISGEVIIPGGTSISRAIINAWHGAHPISS